MLPSTLYNSYPFSNNIWSPIRHFFCLLLISPHPFTPQILTSSVAHINLSVTSYPLMPCKHQVPSQSLRLQTPISSLTEFNSTLHFIFHAPIFPQSCFSYRGNGSSKAGGSSNMLGSFYETIWCQILEDIIIFMENSRNANVRTKQIRQILPTHCKLYMFLFTN
jgi:hypothetical protein